ncbi:McnC protein [Calothrix sp. NIES-4071]|nr:McnC protein [Calothrix sp. NIES-4071]BAZ60474.1 McnC protein [Calothrix sp. NIES-4105]
MNTIEFLSYLRQLDIQIVAEGFSLRAHAKEGTLTPELRAEIQKRKPEIIALLKTNTTSYTNTQILPLREANPPLSFAQQRLWFLDQLVPNNPFYNVPFALRLTGTLDIKALQFTFQEIIRRHDALRTNFVLLQEQPIQIIAPKLQTPLKVIDLRHLAKGERFAQAQQLITQEVQRPFNLSTGSLLRIILLQLDDTKYILLINLHHIISDGWSIGVLIKEIAAFYENISLPELPIQYADFARWQRQYLQGEVLQNLLNYWRHHLDNISVLNLPTDRPRPEVATYKGKRKFLQLPAQLSQALKTLSQQEGVTLFITLLAAFQILLYRYTGQDDIAIGSPIANRNRSEVEGLIGFFVNSLVLRTDLSGNPTFKELLYRVREVALGAYQNQDLPFEKLVELLHPERNLNQNPLFQVVFAMQNAPQSTLELPGLTLSPLQLEYETTRFDLEFHLWEGENVWVNSEGISGFIIYSTDLFDEATITRMLGHFQVLLEGIVNNPEQRIANLPLLTQAEQHQLLVEWNNTHVDYPQDRCIHQLFEEQVNQNPDALALMFLNVETRSRSVPQVNFASPPDIVKTQNFPSPANIVKTRHVASLHYGELNIRSNQIAHYLQKLGVGASVIVALCVDRSIDLVAGMLGILKAGGAYLPLDPSYPTARLNYMLEDAQVKIVLTQQQWVEHLGEHELQIICLDKDWETIAQESQENPHSNITVDNLAYVIYTSGSTGKPKGVQIEHRALLNLVYWHQKAFCISPQDRATQIASVAFDACVWEIFPYLSAGATLYFPDDNTRRAPEQLQEWLNNNAITISFVPTPLCERLLLLDWSNKATKLRILLTGGDKLNYYPATEYPFAIVNNYGPTENTVVTTSGNIPTIGRPIANTQVYILDEHLQLVPIGVKGELYIAGDGLTRGYINNPELTNILWSGHPCPPGVNTGDFHNSSSHKKIYKTGDLGRYLQDGNIEFLGRVDNQVKIRGYRIELEEIEAILNQHPAVQQAVVTTQNTTSQHSLIAYIVLNKTSVETRHVASLHDSLLDEQICQWQMLYNETYNQHATESDPTFNIVGWNSSYTKAPIPAESVREWVNNQVAQILALQPSRVLEIGCGTGLLLFRIAPHCTKYYGTDFSSVSLNYIRQQLANVETKHVKTRLIASLQQRVTLFEKMATDFEGIETQAFDAVVLNSVVQYFPSIDYLTQVLEGAIQATAPGGFIFIGDVRSLPLLEAFHAEVELYQAEPSVTREQLRQRVQMQIFQETELVIDPAFFYALKQRFPQISDVEIQLLRGRDDNELTRYRYNAIVKVGEVDPPNPPYQGGLKNVTQNPTQQGALNNLTQNPPYQGGQGGSILDWNENNLSLLTLRQLLSEKPEILHITNVPNARVTAAVKTAQWISGAEEYKTVSQMREALQRLENLGVDPEDFCALVNELPYSINISWSNSNTEGRYDILFLRQDIINKPTITQLTTQHSALSTQHSNNPLQAKAARKIIPQLQTYLAQKLPKYMVPSAFIVLESLPVNQAGKIDRHAIPQPDTIKKEFSEAYIAPRSDVEKTLVKIFIEVLGIKRCGIHDNFFELGGHSLLATQLASRVRDAFKVELPLSNVFEAPTIAGLSKVVESLKDSNAKSQAPALVPISRDSRRMKLSSLKKDEI